MKCMSRSNPVNELWGYLPAFRAVAETQHLPRAAAQLHVVPSALSRSLKLVEEGLGQKLFSRVGGRLTLNQHGRALLESLRRAMQSVERGMVQATAGGVEGEYRVSTLGVITNHVVLPELLALAGIHPGFVPVMRNYRATEANHRMMLGEIDIAFFYDAVPFAGVTCKKLGEIGNSVYCGRGHPLFGGRRATREMLLRHAFSVPTLGDRNTPMDSWPVHLERRVGFQIELLLTNLEVCLSGRYLTVLPDIVALPHLRAGALRRFPFDLVPPTEVYGACRVGEEDAGVVRELMARVAKRLATSRAPSRAKRS
jgi:DNA-binding transcriptional LysR family regulator